MNKKLTLGSLFDGSGTFPVAGILSGITPIWASEIEPFPIRVTTKRLPFVKHLGDINHINGAEIEPVDIITFGSPCTDLSIAGKRAGLNAERSGLFFQAVRIIKEMRCATNGKYPRFAVWENVAGAFSSNGGEDFRCVLEELCKIKDPDISVPKPAKWTKAGEIVGDSPKCGEMSRSDREDGRPLGGITLWQSAGTVTPYSVGRCHEVTEGRGSC